MYGVLSVASLGFELGEEFYEDCDLFLEEIVPLNLPALLYASKIAMKPFSLIKGPDVLNLEVEPDDAQDGDMIATATASDSRMLNGEHYTGDQGVANVRFYVDVHPEDYADGDLTWEVQSTVVNTDTQTFRHPLTELPSGRHMLFAQAMDNDGFLGPVSSRFFDVERRETASPSSNPTSHVRGCFHLEQSLTFEKSLTYTLFRPDLQPTTLPTVAPSKSPTEAPSYQVRKGICSMKLGLPTTLICLHYFVFPPPAYRKPFKFSNNSELETKFV